MQPIGRSIVKFAVCNIKFRISVLCIGDVSEFHTNITNALYAGRFLGDTQKKLLVVASRDLTC